MTEDIENDATSLAEDQITRKLAQIVGMKFGDQLCVGDEFDLTGKYNMAVFGISGGGDQDQGWNSGCSAWHTEGIFFGVFAVRKEALRVVSLLMKKKNIPFEGGANTALPNVMKVYLRTHPTVKRVRRAVANGQEALLVEVQAVLGVAYCTTEES